MTRPSLLGALLFVCGVTPALAQDGTRVPVPHQQTISANPFGVMLGWFNAEYERKITDNFTLGASGSTFGLVAADVQRANVLFRFYPQGAALTGVFFGGRGGVARVSEGDLNGHAFAAGVEIGYSWLFGAKRNVGLSLGAGVDRLFGGDLHDFDLIWPQVRLVNIGIAF